MQAAVNGEYFFLKKKDWLSLIRQSLKHSKLARKRVFW